MTAAVRRVIEDDRFPYALRLVPMRTALAKFDEAKAADAGIRAEADAHPKAPPPAKAEKRARR